MDRRVSIELDYSLSVLKPRVLAALPALAGNALIPDLGRCVSRRDDDGSGFQVGWDAAGELPSCLSVSLHEGAPERAGPETFICDLDYEPKVSRFSEEPIGRFVRKLSREDLARGASAGGSDADLEGAAVVFRLYAAVAHFSRHVVVTPGRALDSAAAPPPPSR